MEKSSLPYSKNLFCGKISLVVKICPPRTGFVRQNHYEVKNKKTWL